MFHGKVSITHVHDFMNHQDRCTAWTRWKHYLDNKELQQQNKPKDGS